MFESHGRQNSVHNCMALRVTQPSSGFNQNTSKKRHKRHLIVTSFFFFFSDNFDCIFGSKYMLWVFSRIASVMQFF